MTAPDNTLTYSPPPMQAFLRDVVAGGMAVARRGVVLLGMAMAVGAVLLATHADLRHSAEQQLLGWLQDRHNGDVLVAADPTAVDRVTALDPTALPKEQALVDQWLSRKYRVAPEPLSALVVEAYDLGEKTDIDPTLILAVTAIESRFNPFAASPVGAHGLMQVMTRWHSDKYEGFGGTMAAFDPLTNLRVGTQVLQDTIRRAGSIEGGLRLYVGAVTTDGSGYINRVLSEHDRLQRVAQGQRVGFNASASRAAPPPPAALPLLPTLPEGEIEAEANPSQVERVAQAS